MGPNSAKEDGSLLIMIERYVEYAAQCMAKMQRENIRTMAPRPEAVENFTRFCHSYSKNTVYSEECSSWYKTTFPPRSEDEEPVVEASAVWPGSSLHGVKALAKPRWEDFEYTYVDGNPFGWFRNGWTKGDHDAVNGFVSGNPASSYYLDGSTLYMTRWQLAMGHRFQGFSRALETWIPYEDEWPSIFEFACAILFSKDM